MFNMQLSAAATFAIIIKENIARGLGLGEIFLEDGGYVEYGRVSVRNQRDYSRLTTRVGIIDIELNCWKLKL